MTYGFIFYSWNFGEFDPCSATCNGVQMRTVTCTSGIGGVQSILADIICERNIGPKPETTRSCNELVCAQWVVGDFGEVSNFLLTLLLNVLVGRLRYQMSYLNRSIIALGKGSR